MSWKTPLAGEQWRIHVERYILWFESIINKKLYRQNLISCFAMSVISSSHLQSIFHCSKSQLTVFCLEVIVNNVCNFYGVVLSLTIFFYRTHTVYIPQCLLFVSAYPRLLIFNRSSHTLYNKNKNSPVTSDLSIIYFHLNYSSQYMKSI